MTRIVIAFVVLSSVISFAAEDPEVLIGLNRSVQNVRIVVEHDRRPARPRLELALFLVAHGLIVARTGSAFASDAMVHH